MATIKIERLKVLTTGNILAFADVNISDKIIIHGCKLISGEKGDFIGYPSQKGNDNKWYSVIKIPDETLNAEIFSAIKAEYQRESGNIKANPEEPEPF